MPAEVWRDKLRAREHNDVVVMRQTGHAPMLERPHESAALVFHWWRKHALVR